jgi:hypothetical protein
MLRLYTESHHNAQDIELVEQIPESYCQALRRNAIRYMEEKHEPPGAIEILRQIPFELWRGTNDFGDKFELLYLKVDVETYAELERQIDIGDLRSTQGYPAVASALEALGHEIRFIAVEMNLEETVKAVSVPSLIVTSEVVETALRNAETLLGTDGARSALDRVHTAFHGYLESLCAKNGIPFADDVSITALFALLREKVPSLRLADPEAQGMIDQLLRGMAKIVDALDPIRNRKSLAHPNPSLLKDPEAMLAINCIRTMFHYLNSRT